jgi:hypothetical protein
MTLSRHNPWVVGAVVVLIAVPLWVGAQALRGQETFTVHGGSVIGTFKQEEHITLATVDIYAKHYDLDGKSFRVQSIFARDKEFADTRSVGLMYDCPEIIKQGETATCTVKVQFVRPEEYYYKLMDLSIERPGATSYNPEIKKMNVGEGKLSIPLLFKPN